MSIYRYILHFCFTTSGRLWLIAMAFFAGPGTVFMQTRNPVAFGQWLATHMPAGQ